MRAYAKCGACFDELEVRGLDTVAEVQLVLYAFWAEHRHDGEVPRPDMTDPANIPGVAHPIEDWERELLSPPEDDQ